MVRLTWKFRWWLADRMEELVERLRWSRRTRMLSREALLKRSRRTDAAMANLKKAVTTPEDAE